MSHIHYMAQAQVFQIAHGDLHAGLVGLKRVVVHVTVARYLHSCAGLGCALADAG